MLLCFAGLLAFDLVKRAVCIAHGPSPLNNDAVGFWIMGKALAEGNWQELHALLTWRTPGYPALVALAHRLPSGNPLFVLVIGQHCLGFLTSLLTAGAVYQLSGNRLAALGAYAIGAVSVGQALYANMVLSEVLFTFLLTVHCAVLYRGLRTASYSLMGVAGGLLGLLTLVKPVAQLLWAAEAVTILVIARGMLRPRFTLAAILTIASVAVIGAWAVRNSVVYQTRPFLTQFLGRNLWISCFGPGVGRLDMPTDDTEIRANGVALELYRDEAVNYQSSLVYGALCARGLSPTEADALMERVCKRAIGRQPLRYLAGCVERFVHFWWIGAYFQPALGDAGAWTRDPGLEVRPWYSPTGARISEQFAQSRLSAWARSWLDRAFVLSSLTCAVVGLATKLRPWFLLNLFILLYFAGVTSAVEEPLYRYRLIIEPVLSINFGLGVAFVMNSLWIRDPTGEQRERAADLCHFASI